MPDRRPPDEEIPAEVRDLIYQHVDAVEQLEVLLLLHRGRDRDWTPLEVSEELRTNLESTATRLEDLTHRGLVGDGSRAESYRFQPRSAALGRAVDGLAREYAVRRVSVTTMIFAKPLERIRSFADAFRFRRGSDA